jgi:hypothetical protein
MKKSSAKQRKGQAWMDEVFQNQTLSGMEVNVALYLQFRCYGNRTECWPTVRRIATDLRHHPDTVRKALRGLRKAGLLEVIAQLGRTNRYRLILVDAPKETIDPTEIDQGYPTEGDHRPLPKENITIDPTEIDQGYPTEGDHRPLPKENIREYGHVQGGNRKVKESKKESSPTGTEKGKVYEPEVSTVGSADGAAQMFGMPMEEWSQGLIGSETPHEEREYEIAKVIRAQTKGRHDYSQPDQTNGRDQAREFLLTDPDPDYHPDDDDPDDLDAEGRVDDADDDSWDAT